MLSSGYQSNTKLLSFWQFWKERSALPGKTCPRTNLACPVPAHRQHNCRTGGRASLVLPPIPPCMAICGRRRRRAVAAAALRCTAPGVSRPGPSRSSLGVGLGSKSGGGLGHKRAELLGNSQQLQVRLGHADERDCRRRLARNRHRDTHLPMTLYVLPYAPQTDRALDTSGPSFSAKTSRSSLATPMSCDPRLQLAKMGTALHLPAHCHSSYSEL